MHRKPLLITTFGLGHMRPAPGTWGSLPPLVVPIGFYLAGCTTDCRQSCGSWWLYHGLLIGIAVFFSMVCLMQGDRAEAAFGRKDPSQVVADETAGQAIALMFLPAGAFSSTSSMLAAVAVAFLSFRLLDIVKPWPAKSLQRIPGGLGILIDDLIAGGYALAITQFILRY
ncbi:MAG: phosphatidylglycerophosphatase A [Phycisphaerales bacterium]